ncbi:putative MFS-type transporter [Cyphellophora attinorum]|uniref:Putative MFS-type transporter n=1 Tax=Cyphellophora attinorum TaxID=1664694 RepID=A0A0N1HX71_9EURO|nr:putative MFS-type transporter [Phialophora attinorum]KPI45056.1 putative MFS-type transporter [Phialophora attinorum]
MAMIPELVSRPCMDGDGGLLLGLLLAVIETSISATALVTIGRYFEDFPNSTWVILSYLLGYSGFAIVVPRLSDNIGRRPAAIFSWTLFMAFSLGAGLSKTLRQLIVCRALQGVGGTGMFSMTMIMLPQITPVKRWPIMSTCVGLVFAIASVSGPVLGGVITEYSTWRWIYLYNAPIASVGVLPLLFLWPTSATSNRRPDWKHFDYFGALLLITASSLIIFVLNQVGADFYRWQDPLIIVLTTVSCVSWCSFAFWVAFWSFKVPPRINPIFPGDLAARTPQGPTLLTAVLSGFPYFISVINLPQRFQLVNGQSPVSAGLRLMPFLSFFAAGTAVAGKLNGKKNRTPETLIAGSVITVIGCGLLSTLSNTAKIEAKQYGYQVLLGMGIGLCFAGSMMLINIETRSNQLAAAQGAISQARVLGGSAGLAMGTIVLNKNITRLLGGLVSPSQLQNIRHSLASIESLDTAERLLAVEAFSEAFSTEMRICCYVSIATVLTSLATWKRHKTPLPVND